MKYCHVILREYKERAVVCVRVRVCVFWTLEVKVETGCPSKKHRDASGLCACHHVCAAWSCAMEPRCAEVGCCACNNVFCSKKGSRVSGLPLVLSECVEPPASSDKSHTLRGEGVFGSRLCGPHLRPPRPAECCMVHSRLIHSTLAQTCHRLIYILHWHLCTPSLTSLQYIFHQHVQWDEDRKVGGSGWEQSFSFYFGVFFADVHVFVGERSCIWPATPCSHLSCFENLQQQQ